MLRILSTLYLSDTVGTREFSLYGCYVGSAKSTVYNSRCFIRALHFRMTSNAVLSYNGAKIYKLNQLNIYE